MYLGFEISMDEVVLVQTLNTLQKLRTDSLCLAFRHPTLQMTLKVPELNMFHSNVDLRQILEPAEALHKQRCVLISIRMPSLDSHHSAYLRLGEFCNGFQLLVNIAPCGWIRLV